MNHALARSIFDPRQGFQLKMLPRVAHRLTVVAADARVLVIGLNLFERSYDRVLFAMMLESLAAELGR